MPACTRWRGSTAHPGAGDWQDDDSLRAGVKKAEELAAIAPPNPEHMPALGPQKYVDTPDFDEPTSTVRAAEMLPHVKSIIDAAIKNKLVAAGLVERSLHVNAVAN